MRLCLRPRHCYIIGNTEFDIRSVPTILKVSRQKVSHVPYLLVSGHQSVNIQSVSSEKYAIMYLKSQEPTTRLSGP